MATFTGGGGGGDLSVFRYKSNGWHYNSTISGYRTSSNAFSANYLYAYPVYFPTAQSVTGIGVYVYSSALGNARLGIYKDNGSIYPGELVVDAGEVDLSTSGVKEITISETLGPGLYWVVIVMSDVPYYYCIEYRYALAIMGGSQPGFSSNTCYIVSYTYGALPDPFTTGGSSSAKYIPIWLKFG